MKNRIYRNFLGLTIFVVAVTAIMLTTIFYSFSISQISNELRIGAQQVNRAMSQAVSDLGFLQSLRLVDLGYRIDLIDDQGQVLFDSTARQLPTENHAHQPEVQEALNTGVGEDKRYSEDLQRDVYYYALRTSEGNILRLSRTTESIWDIYLSELLPVGGLMLLLFLLCHYLSKQLTRRIVAPINELGLDEDNLEAYDELSPLLGKITRQKEQINRQIRKLERRANAILAITDEMQEGLLLMDAKGMILSANNSAMRLFGDRYKNGISVLQLHRDVTFIKHVKDTLEGTPNDAVITFGHKTVQVFFNPVFDKEKKSGALLLFQDITEKANAERIRREFSANVSHELKTPLTSILGFSEILSSGMGKGEDTAQIAAKIHTEVKRLIILIDDIIKLSELDESDGEKQLESFDLQALAHSVAEGLTPAAEEREVTIEVEGGRMNITANRNMIGELLFNLLDNGIKNNKPGGTVTVSFRREGETTLIQVTDTGIGIAKEHLDRVFERFYQVDKSRSKKTGGTGLGLSIVKHIAQYHNGHATIESKVGQGTTVTAVLRNS